MSAANYTSDLLNNCDVLCLQEHHLFPETGGFLKTLDPKYRAEVDYDRINHNLGNIRVRKGGLAIMWRRDLDYCVAKLELPASDHSDRIMGISMQVNGMVPIYIINVYLPSSNYPMECYREVCSLLHVVCETYAGKGILILAGDFNGQINSERFGPRINTRGYCLQEIMTFHNLYSTVSHGTCAGPVYTYLPDSDLIFPSQIDHFLVPIEYGHLIVTSIVHGDDALNTSDHLPISIAVNVNVARYECMTRTMFCWSRCDKVKYKTTMDSLLQPLISQTIDSTADIDRYLGNIQSCAIESMHIAVPVVKHCAFKRPYWDSELSAAHTKQKYLRLLWVREGRPRGFTFESYKVYKVAKREFAKMLREKAILYERLKYVRLEENADLDFSKLWKHLRKQSNNGQSVHCISHNGKLHSTPKELRDFWQSHFTGLLNEQPNDSASFDNCFKHDIETKVANMINTFSKHTDNTGVLNTEFAVDEVAKVCWSLPNGKAPGLDMIPYEGLKLGTESLYIVLTRLYNAITRHVYVPVVLKHSIIIPLHKGKRKPKNKPDSYRGVSLTPSINKVLEKLVLNRLKPWLANHNFPPPLQHSGREGCSSVTLSYVVQEVINHHCASGSKVYACFLDIKSAFDVIWWDGLLYKMSTIGVKNKLWWLFKNWLMDSSGSVLLNGEISNSFNITRSIKQGGLLSVFYFTVAYFDIHNTVRCGNDGLKYYDIDVGSPTLADDTVLLSNTVAGLQRMINKAFQFSRQWRINFSIEKTKCMTFGESRRSNNANQVNREWKLGSFSIDEVSHFTHVGNMLCAYGSSQQRTSEVCKKGNALYGSLMSCGLHATGLSPKTCLNIWQRTCLPSFLFSCEVWGSLTNREYTAIERVFKLFLKSVQALDRRTHDEVVRGLLGCISLKGHIDKCKLNFIRKLISLPPNTLVKQIFMYQSYHCLVYGWNREARCITADLINVSKNYGLYSYVLSYLSGGSFPDKRVWRNIVSESVCNAETEQWNQGLVEKGAYRFMRIQPDLEPNYIYGIMKHHLMSRTELMLLVKQLALPEIHHMAITCNLCGKIMPDIPLHMIMECTELIDIRTSMWDNILDNLGVEAEVDLFQREDWDILDIFLGRKWGFLQNREDHVQFTLTIANSVKKMFYRMYPSN
jgi:endonuclease/exonuclease/phosphatase family metal-dependent hydrolase